MKRPETAFRYSMAFYHFRSGPEIPDAETSITPAHKQARSYTELGSDPGQREGSAEENLVPAKPI